MTSQGDPQAVEGALSLRANLPDLQEIVNPHQSGEKFYVLQECQSE